MSLDVMFGRVNKNYFFGMIIIIVGSVFRAQTLQVGDSGPKNPRQWICRERVTELGLNEVNVS